MIIERVLAGSLFLLIIILNLASDRFGYETFGKIKPETKLRETSDNLSKFKTGFALIIIEHASIVALAVVMFVAFNEFNTALAATWLVVRTGEGLIQIYYKKNYWRLLKLGRRFSGAGEAEKSALTESVREILITKNRVFMITQVLFSIGTVAYSSLFVAYDVVPLFIGWFGIAAGIIYGAGNVIKLARTESQAVWNIGGLLVLIFELVLGGWLVINTIVTS